MTALHEDEEPLVWPCLDTVDHGGWPQGEKGDPNQQSSNRDNSGDLHSADSPNPDAPAKYKAIDATGNTASIRKVALASDTERGGAMRPSELKVYATRLNRWSEPFPIRSKSP